MRSKWRPDFDRWWKDADLATRISVVSSLIAATPLLMALVISVATIQSLLWAKVEADLRFSSHSTLLRIESRVEQLVDKLAAMSTHPVLSNALLDAGEIERYVDDSLRDVCETTEDVLAVALVDFQGRPLSQSCQRNWREADSHKLLAETAIGSGQISVKAIEGVQGTTLVVAAPIIYLPTGSMEGALIGEIDLSHIFSRITSQSQSYQSWALRQAPSGQLDDDVLQASAGRLVLSRTVSPIRDRALDLVVDLSVDKRRAYTPIYWLLVGFAILSFASLYLIVRQSRTFAQWLVGPLKSLERTAEFVSAGVLDRLPPVTDLPRGEDSLSKLTRRIHRMLCDLKDTQDGLALAVDERTAHLEQIEADRRLKELALASTKNGVLILRQDRSDAVKRVYYANDAFFALTGFASAEVVGAVWPDLLLQRGRPINTGGQSEPETSDLSPVVLISRDDETRIYVSVSTSPIVGADSDQTVHQIVVLSDVSERTRAEYAHRARLESLREIFFETDLEGRASFLNQAWKTITGYEISKCLGQRLIRFVRPADLQMHLRALRKIRDRKLESYAFEARIRSSDGSLRWLRIDTGYLTNELGEIVGFSGTMADVTVQHEASMALALRDRALQAASNGIIIASLESPDCPIIYANPAFERITGYTAAEALGKNCRFLHAKDRSQPEIGMLRKAIANRQDCQVTLRNYRKDGRAFWNQLTISPVVHPASGAVTHYIGVQTDITERKNSEDILVEWLSRLDAIFTLSPDPIVCFDSEGRLSYANAAAERTFQTSLGALKDMRVKTFYDHVRRHARSASSVDALIPRDESPNSVLGAAEVPPDVVIELETPVRRILQQTYRYCGSTSTSLVLYYRDITREAELDRMKSEFLSTAAHELRTPMASIMGFSELLMMRRYDEAKTHELLATINRQAQRLTTLLTDLLDLARIEARRAEGLHFEWMPLCPLLDDTLSAFLTPEGRQPVIRRWVNGAHEIRADRGKFQQALFNLLSNAYKFSPDGGDIHVDIVGSHPRDASLVGIEVRDHGIGLSSEEKTHVFERFYRSDRSGHIPGTGLGLSLVKEIMLAHGGDVTLESMVNEGTTVTLWFPGRCSPATPDLTHTAEGT